MRLIDAGALKERFKDKEGDVFISVFHFYETIDNAPTIEERKTGKWIFGETMGHSWMKCSECCKSQDGQTLCFTYCPNCGAKMEGSEWHDEG